MRHFACIVAVLLVACTHPAETVHTGQTAPSPARTSQLNLQALWNFADPTGSEQRFRSALAHANTDDAIILHTQIARSHGLRRDFERARVVLLSQQALLANASPEARVRHALEWGRSWASGTHQPEQLTPDARQQARQSWQQALDLARAHRLDGLAVDAIHMFAFVDTTPAQQQAWAEQALALVLASDQPAAQRWQASIRNNLGLALQQQGQHESALAQFRHALALRQAMGNAAQTLMAGYMVGRSLRLHGQQDEALAMQLKLLRDSEALGAADPYVLDELALLHRARGEVGLADAAQARAAALRQAPAKP